MFCRVYHFFESGLRGDLGIENDVDVDCRFYSFNDSCHGIELSNNVFDLFSIAADSIYFVEQNHVCHDQLFYKQFPHVLIIDES